MKLAKLKQETCEKKWATWNTDQTYFLEESLILDLTCINYWNEVRHLSHGWSLKFKNKSDLCSGHPVQCRINEQWVVRQPSTELYEECQPVSPGWPVIRWTVVCRSPGRWRPSRVGVRDTALWLLSSMSTYHTARPRHHVRRDREPRHLRWRYQVESFAILGEDTWHDAAANVAQPALTVMECNVM